MKFFYSKPRVKMFTAPQGRNLWEKIELVMFSDQIQGVFKARSLENGARMCDNIFYYGRSGIRINKNVSSGSSTRRKKPCFNDYVPFLMLNIK